MIETILSLSLRGSLVYLFILGINRLSAKDTKCAARRIWWLIAAASFLIPNPFSQSFFAESWSFLHSEVPNVSSSGGEVASLVSLAGSAGQTVATPIITSLHTAPSIEWLPILWLAGVVISLGIVIVQTLITSRRWSRERLCTDPSILSLLEDCKMEAGITVPIGIVLSTRISAPAILGWLRPKIILPTNLVVTFSPEQLMGILFHELAHFKWLDVPSNWIFVLVRAVHWFNPFAYLAAKNWASFREEAADELAMKWMGGGEGYGETLVAALRQNPGTDIPYGALAIGESLKNIKERITQIGQYTEKKGHLLMVSFAALVVITLGLVLLPLGLYAADSPLPEFIRNVGTYHLSPRATLAIFPDPYSPNGYLQYKYSSMMDQKYWAEHVVGRNPSDFEFTQALISLGSIYADPAGFFFFWDERGKVLWLATHDRVSEIFTYSDQVVASWATSDFLNRPVRYTWNFPGRDKKIQVPQQFADEVRRVFGNSTTSLPLVQVQSLNAQSPHVVDFGVVEISQSDTNHFDYDLGNGKFCVVRSFVNADSNIVTSASIEVRGPEVIGGAQPLITFNAETNPLGQAVEFSNGIYTINVRPQIKASTTQEKVAPLASQGG